jgi:hypothetical protein
MSGASTNGSDFSADVRNVEETERLRVSTVLRRSDVAPGNRCYQSSTVDGLSAEVAISPPYSRTTRTRREVDPWWEVDFSRRVHLESISLQALTGHMQKIFISVLLLSQPTGFEDPFLDSAIPKSVVWKEFLLPESSAPKLESIEWMLPPNSVCAAIRVQIRGIHTLSLGSFQAYMGDEFIEGRDVEINMTKNSYATMSLADLKLAREAMVSPEQKRARLRLAKLEAERRSVKRKNASRAEIEGRLSSISQLIDQRFRYIDAWRSHVLTFVAEMEEDFINKLFHLVFVAAVNEGLRAGTAKNNLPPNRSLPQMSSRVVSSRDIASRQRFSKGRPSPAAAQNNNGAAGAVEAEADDATTGSGFFLTEDACQHSGAGTGPDSPQSTVAEDRKDDESEQSHEVNETLTYGLADSDLEDFALTCHYPRCELQDLYMRIRGLLVQISSRHNLKGIGVLGSDETMTSIAEDYNDYLPGLQKEFRLMDEAWQLSFDASRDKDGRPKKDKRDPSENRGVCWSQFLIIFRLFMQKRFKEMASAIQPPAFKAELSAGSATRREAAAAAAAAHLPPDALDEQRDNSQPSTPVGSPDPGARKAWSGSGSKPTGLGGKMPGDRLAALLTASTMSPTYGGPLLKASHVEAPLLFNARDPAMPVLDTRFSEYKLTNFRRRVAGEMVSCGSLLFSPSPSPSSPSFPSSSADPHPATKQPSPIPRCLQEFPPTLTLDFTQKLLDFQKSKAQQRAAATDKPTTAGAGTGGAASASASKGNKVVSAASDGASAADVGGAEAGVAIEPALVFADDFSRGESKSAQPKEHDFDPSEEIGAPRSCALCVYTFPRSATATQVMWKHVITLRRLWDPDGSLGLVPKELELLEQGTSMFNLVNVCPLCYQFFDPDLADLAYPNTLRRNIKATKKSAIGLPSADTVVTDPFLDERYPLRDANLFADRSLLESRHRARKLLQLLAAQQREGTEDE